MPNVRKAGAAAVYAKAQLEHSPRGTTPDTRARTARLTRPGRIPPTWIGRTTCRTPMVTAWRRRICSGVKNMPWGLDQWGRFHELDWSETDRAYQRFRTLREQYGCYHGQGEGQPPGPLSTIRLPHTKGTTPDKDMTPAPISGI